MNEFLENNIDREKRVKCTKGESVGFVLSNSQKFRMSHGSNWSSFSSNHHMKQHSPASNYWQQSFGKCDYSGKRTQQEGNNNQNQASSFSVSNRHIKQHFPENNCWPRSFGKCNNSGERNEAHSNQNQASSLKFSGMNLGDVMKVTVMEEMKNLKMSKDVPLDLSMKSGSKKNEFSLFKKRSK